MKSIKGSFGILSGFLALTLLGGCLTGDDPESASGFALTAESEVVDIETPDADEGEPGVLTTSEVEYSCVDGELEEDEYEDAMLYAITGGFLYTWYENECTAQKFSGTSSKIQGTWTSTDLSTRIPSAYRPIECEGVSPEEDIEEILKDAVVTYTISSSKVKAKVTGEFCMAPLLAEQYKGGEDVSVVSSGCSTVKLRNDDVERTATISASYKNDKLTETIAYNGKTCKISYPLQLSNEPPTCSEDAEEEQEEMWEDFQDCIEDSEFSDDFASNIVFKKGSGLPAAFEKALKRARPF